MSKHLWFWSNFKELWNEYLIIFEIFTNFFNISTKIRPYNDRDFEPNVEPKMIEVLTQIFNISTKVRDILKKFLKCWPHFRDFDQIKGNFDHSTLLYLTCSSPLSLETAGGLYSTLVWFGTFWSLFSKFSTKARDISNKISKMLTTFSRFWSNK